MKEPNGSIRLCTDFSTGLRALLDQCQYPLPVPEDLFTKLNGEKIFAKLDLSDAYLEISVEAASRRFLTIHTHKGLFQYQRLPFDVETAPAIFQQFMDTMLHDDPGVAAYLDVIIVIGSDQPNLEYKFGLVLQRIDDNGLRVRLDEYGLFRVKYLGFIVDQRGRHPDPFNLDAIKLMPQSMIFQLSEHFCGPHQLLQCVPACAPSISVTTQPPSDQGRRMVVIN